MLLKQEFPKSIVEFFFDLFLDCVSLKTIFSVFSNDSPDTIELILLVSFSICCFSGRVNASNQ